MEKSWGIVQNYPKYLPFYTNFDQVTTVSLFSHTYMISKQPGMWKLLVWNNSQNVEQTKDREKNKQQLSIYSSQTSGKAFI